MRPPIPLLSTFSLLCFCFLSAGCNQPPAAPVESPKWIVYTSENSSILNDHVNCILVDNSDWIWFGTDAGALGYRSGTWESIIDSLTYKSWQGQTDSQRVTAIAQGRDGSYWFGLHGGGVKRFFRSGMFPEWRQYHHPDIPWEIITCLTVDRYQGDLWVGTPFGFGRFVPDPENPKEGTWQRYDSLPIPNNQISALAYNQFDSLVYIGTHRGALSFNGISRCNLIMFSQKYDYPVTSIAFDLSQGAWFTKWEGITYVGTDHFEIKNYTWENTDNQLPTGMVYAVVTDLFSTRWFGTERGLLQLQDNSWTKFSRSNSPLPCDTITALALDKKKNLWIVTSNGVAVYNENGIKF